MITDAVLAALDITDHVHFLAELDRLVHRVVVKGMVVISDQICASVLPDPNTLPIAFEYPFFSFNLRLPLEIQE